MFIKRLLVKMGWFTSFQQEIEVGLDNARRNLQHHAELAEYHGAMATMLRNRINRLQNEKDGVK